MSYRITPITSFDLTYTPPPDKSITHRAIMLLSISKGTGIIKNYLDSDDCLRTLDAFKKMGINIKVDKGILEIEGVGPEGLKPPQTEIYAGNSGTTARLICGILAGQEFETKITGDDSLSRRPMKRIIEPLRMMGTEIQARDDNYLPITIRGKRSLNPIEYTTKTASAQVKSCILFAGIYSDGVTTVIEPVKSRNHSELMLSYLGANISAHNTSVSITGHPELKAKEIEIPGDISSAAFFITAALLTEDSKIEIKNVGLNPTRVGFLNILKKMGASIEIKNIRTANNELIGDLIVKSSKLKQIDISAEDIPQMIDEIPLLTLIATQIEGQTKISGAQELRVKESDRLKTISTELNKMGAKITELYDGLIIEGKTKLKGCEVESYEDHRIAMTLAIAGLIADGETIIRNHECVKVSYPSFWNDLEKLK